MPRAPVAAPRRTLERRHPREIVRNGPRRERRLPPPRVPLASLAPCAETHTRTHHPDDEEPEDDRGEGSTVGGSWLGTTLGGAGGGGSVCDGVAHRGTRRIDVGDRSRCASSSAFAAAAARRRRAPPRRAPRRGEVAGASGRRRPSPRPPRRSPPPRTTRGNCSRATRRPSPPRPPRARPPRGWRPAERGAWRAARAAWRGCRGPASWPGWGRRGDERCERTRSRSPRNKGRAIGPHEEVSRRAEFISQIRNARGTLLFLAALVPPPSRPRSGHTRSRPPHDRHPRLAHAAERLDPLQRRRATRRGRRARDRRSAARRPPASSSSSRSGLLRPPREDREGRREVTLARACAPRWGLLFRLDAREAATSRGVITVLVRPSVLTAAAVLAESGSRRSPRFGAAGREEGCGERVDPPVARDRRVPRRVQSPSRLHLLPSAAPLGSIEPRRSCATPARARPRASPSCCSSSACRRGARRALRRSSRRRRSRGGDGGRSRRRRGRGAGDAREASRGGSDGEFHPSPSSPSLSSFSSSSGGERPPSPRRRRSFPTTVPRAPSFLPTATPPRWNIVADVDPVRPSRRGRLVHLRGRPRGRQPGGVEERTWCVLAAPPRRAAGRNSIQTSGLRGPRRRVSKPRDGGVVEATDTCCAEEAVPVVVPAPGEKSRLAE